MAACGHQCCMCCAVIIGLCAASSNSAGTKCQPHTNSVIIGAFAGMLRGQNYSYNVVIGGCANCGLYRACTTYGNVFAGFAAAAYYLGHDSIAIGHDAMGNLGCTGIGSCTNIAIGYLANAVCSVLYKNVCNIAIGARTHTGGNPQWNCNILIGHCLVNTTACQTILGAPSGNISNTYLCGCIIKGSGSFAIPYPSKGKYGKWLYHSYVESPTRGDNLYRWSINTNNCKYSIELPDYYRHLNENSAVKISSVGHFGKAYGKVSEDGNYLNICSNQDGKYNVLAVATRCDAHALGDNFVVEKDMNERDLEEFGVE